MSIQYSTAVRNAGLDSREVTIGQSPILQLRSGPQPASPQAAATGTVIATMQLPADWMQNAAGGIKTKSGNWEDPQADADGTIGHFRILDSTGTICHMQGSVGLTGTAGADMTVDNTVVKQNQDILINTFVMTAGNP